jgi:hypothetical protein
MASPLSSKESSKANERAKEVERLVKSVEQIWKGLDKVPSYTGKARFMDLVLKAKKRAQHLAWNLAGDLSKEVSEE